MLLNCFDLVVKIVKLVFSGIKHRDSLYPAKQDGSSVNAFCCPDLCRLLSGYISGIDINEQR